MFSDNSLFLECWRGGFRFLHITCTGVLAILVDDYKDLKILLQLTKTKNARVPSVLFLSNLVLDESWDFQAGVLQV